jgi:hypothetical protein
LASACAEYIKFAEAYVSLEDAAVATSIESLKHTFESRVGRINTTHKHSLGWLGDGNLGLVLQCQASLPKHRIKRLTKVPFVYPSLGCKTLTFRHLPRRF